MSLMHSNKVRPEQLLSVGDDRYYLCQNWDNPLFHEAFRFYQNATTLFFFELAGTYKSKAQPKEVYYKKRIEISCSGWKNIVWIGDKEGYCGAEYIFKVPRGNLVYNSTSTVKSIDSKSEELLPDAIDHLMP